MNHLNNQMTVQAHGWPAVDELGQTSLPHGSSLPRVSVCFSNFPSGRRTANESMVSLDGAVADQVENSCGMAKNLANASGAGT